MKTIINILLFIWQMPQNLVGFFYSLFSKEKITLDNIKVYYAPCFNAGVTLGQFIILDPVWKRANPKYFSDTVHHEYGHTIQSKYFGPLYLIVVGIPSVFRNMLNRMKPRTYNQKWYYSGYPENWADKLGGVVR